ncbi:M-phase-specific PLK1-interacting domain-containing protein [Phytophthora infestans]|uniref:M-phase-specific PLK1-interacting domain-containing protein n=1 Tax=Phytophthora infestans TaxID=4787 RepID=A0A833SZJ0_PHYIN|nr:M-phase-specific PLK1-interacting domain-containing protein [Phytophthora infestans]KAF4129205.1 M-phase-specific PLK1-interacting domain-containing protein [Phytophthora infestans]
MATLSIDMQPPPPPGSTPPGPPPPMPPQLQAMMRQMEQRQPKFQQQIQPPAPYQHQQGGRRGGRGGRGRGRGRGGFQQQNYRKNRGYSRNQSHSKRKRGPSDDVRDASRFFLPSFLEDPWKGLETANGAASGDATKEKYVDRQREELRPRQVQYATNNGPGRVFFQPSFLEDPWAQLVH